MNIFFPGSEYWRYTENDGIDSGYPKSIGVWTVNSTTEIDAVIQGPDGKTTLWFSGSQFHIFNDSNYSVSFTIDLICFIGFHMLSTLLVISACPCHIILKRGF